MSEDENENLTVDVECIVGMPTDPDVPITAETAARIIHLIRENNVVMTGECYIGLVELISELAHAVLFPECQCITGEKFNALLGEVRELQNGLDLKWDVTDGETFNRLKIRYNVDCDAERATLRDVMD